MTAAELRQQLKDRVRALQTKRAEIIARANVEVAAIDVRLASLRDLDDIFGQVTFVAALNTLDSAGQSVEVKWN